MKHHKFSKLKFFFLTSVSMFIVVFLLGACGPKFTGLAENVSVSDIAATKRKQRAYKDNFSTLTYHDKYTQATNKPAIFCFGRKQSLMVKHHIHCESCDNSFLEVQNIDTYLNRYDHGWFLDEHKCQRLNKIVNIYNVAALDNFVNVLYSNSTKDNNQFEKITRVAIKFDKLKSKDFMIQMMKYLRDEANKYEADGIIDICMYRKDYNQQSSEYLGPSTTLITYIQKYFVTATLINFKDGFYPEKEFLICGQ